MRAECITAVTQAIGRALTQPEIKGTEDRLRRNMRQLAQTDPTWQSKIAADRLIEAATKSARDLVAEQDLKKKRVALTILAHDRVDSYMKRFPGQPLEGLDRMLAFSSDGKSGIPSIESASSKLPVNQLHDMPLKINEVCGGTLLAAVTQHSTRIPVSAGNSLAYEQWCDRLSFMAQTYLPSARAVDIERGLFQLIQSRQFIEAADLLKNA